MTLVVPFQVLRCLELGGLGELTIDLDGLDVVEWHRGGGLLLDLGGVDLLGHATVEQKGSDCQGT